VKTKVSPGLAKIGNVTGSIIEAVAENERITEGSRSRPTSHTKGSGSGENPLIWSSSSARSYLETSRARSARARPSTAHRLDTIRSSYDGADDVSTPLRSNMGTYPPKPASARHQRGQSATGTPTSYQVYQEGGRPGTGRAKQRAKSARPAGAQRTPGAEGPEGPGYSIKYFGVAHGQLGVLTRRKIPIAMIPGDSSPVRRQSANSRAHSASRLPVTTEPVYRGAPLPQRRVPSGRIRPASAAELRRGPAASSTMRPGSAYKVATRPESAQEPRVSTLSQWGNSTKTPKGRPTSSRPASSTYRLDPSRKKTTFDDEEDSDDDIPAADFDIVNAVEDYSGTSWIPTNAVNGKAFRNFRRPQVHDRYAQYRGDVLGKPVNGYIAHNALQGWKLSPGFAKPHYSPEVAQKTSMAMIGRSTRFSRNDPLASSAELGSPQAPSLSVGSP